MLIAGAQYRRSHKMDQTNAFKKKILLDVSKDVIWMNDLECTIHS